MNEMMFGSGSPMWTAMPSVGLVQPMGIPNRPIAALAFGSPVMSGAIGGASTGGQALYSPPGLSTNIYSYGALNPLAPLFGHEVTGLVTPSSLLATVAMRRGQPQGPTNDHEVEEFIYDALDLLSGAADVEVRCEGGRATLTGSVPHKRSKRDIGEIAWAIPGLQDVQNNISITSRRRARVAGNREAEAPVGGSARKQA